MLKCVAVTLWMLFAVTSPAVADASTQPSVNGVYFLSAPAGSGRLLILDQHEFRLRDLGSGGEIRGSFYVNSASLSFRYFDGKDSILANCTYAIIDGHLWVGVLGLHEGGAKQPVMSGSFTRCGFLGVHARALPDGMISADFQQRRWQFTATDDRGYPIDGITLVNERGERIGTPADVEDGKPFRSDVPERATSQPVFNAWRDRKAVFVRHGNFVVAPTSLDLGPVNLIPRKLAMSESTSWQCETDRTLKEQVAVPTTKPTTVLLSALHFPMGPPSKEQVRDAISRISSEPDERGIVVQMMHWDCGMNHGDFPGFVCWFVTGEGEEERGVRFVYPATHEEGVSQTGVVQFFRRERAAAN